MAMYIVSRRMGIQSQKFPLVGEGGLCCDRKFKQERLICALEGSDHLNRALGTNLSALSLRYPDFIHPY